MAFEAQKNMSKEAASAERSEFGMANLCFASQICVLNQTLPLKELQLLHESRFVRLFRQGLS